MLYHRPAVVDRVNFPEGTTKALRKNQEVLLGISQTSRAALSADPTTSATSSSGQPHKMKEPAGHCQKSPAEGAPGHRQESHGNAHTLPLSPPLTPADLVSDMFRRKKCEETKDSV